MTSASTAEGRAFLQERIALFGKGGALIVLAFYVLRGALMLRSGDRWHGWLDGDGLLTLATGAVLAAVWLVCRGPLRSARTLAIIDAAGSFVACLGAALPLVLPAATMEFKYRALFAITNALIARAAVVPSPPAWTLRVSAASVLPVVALTFVFHQARGDWEVAALVQALVSLLWAAVGVAVAVVTSRVIYGLRQEVRHAHTLGPYTLEEKIGQGGMGVVYRARHALLRRPTAVKLLPPDRSSSASLRRFEREVQLTSMLTHPNTVAVYDYGRTPDGIFYYAMEYLDGVNLDELVRRHGPQPPARVVHIVRQLCGSLAEAHAVGLIHRDVKPANAILCERGGVPDVVKLVDFGLVRETVGVEAALTAADAITGTPNYLSPETLTGPESVDARSDLYSLGALTYYLLTAQHVFDGRTVAEICGHHLHSPVVPPSVRLGAPLPEPLDAIVCACLEKDRALRPQSAQALMEMLQECPQAGGWTAEDARTWWAGHGGGPARSVAAGRAAETAAVRTTLVDASAPTLSREARR